MKYDEQKEGGPAVRKHCSCLSFLPFFFSSPAINLLLLNVQLERGFLGKVPADGF